MEELLIVNPSRRRRRRKSNPHRTAAQRAATRRMIAANRARAHNPRHHHRRRRNPVAGLAMNPRRRRRYSNPVHHYRRRRRHNPIGGDVGSMVQSAFMGALGAVSVNAVYNYLPLPDTLRVGYTSYAVKGALAIGLGMFGKKFLGHRAVKMAEGSLVVTLTTILADLGSKAGLNLSGVAYYAPAVQYVPRQAVGYSPPMSEYVGMGEGMGEYVQ